MKLIIIYILTFITGTAALAHDHWYPRHGGWYRGDGGYEYHREHHYYRGHYEHRRHWNGYGWIWIDIWVWDDDYNE